MNNLQESTVSMSVGVINFLDKNAAIFSILPGSEPLFTKFKVNKDLILVLREQQEVGKKGIRDNKEMLRAVLVDKAYDISRKTEVYATFANNLILAKEVHYSETMLAKSTDSKLESRSLIIYDKAKANIANLAPYGVTNDDLISLKNAMELFSAAVPTTRTSTTEKKLITDKLARLFMENEGILEKIDLLVEIVRLSKPDFYKSYKDNRMIIRTGRSSMALIATATDAVTGKGFKGVKFTFIQEDVNGTETRRTDTLVKITSPKGKFQVKNMTEGPYLVLVEKPGLKSLELHINKAAGDRIKLDVKLEKI